MEPLLPQLVTSVTWDLCCLSRSSPVRGTFVASVGRLCYVGPLPPQLVSSATWTPLVVSATWDLGCLCYMGLDRWISCFRFVRPWSLNWTLPLRRISVAFVTWDVTRLRYVESWSLLLYRETLVTAALCEIYAICYVTSAMSVSSKVATAATVTTGMKATSLQRLQQPMTV